MSDILKMGEDDKEFNMIGEESLKILISKAKYTGKESVTILEEYKIFEERLHELNSCDKTESELIQLNGHILYKVHECTKECTSKDTKTCKEKNKLVFPKEPIPIRHENCAFRFLQHSFHFQEGSSNSSVRKNPFLHPVVRHTGNSMPFHTN